MKILKNAKAIFRKSWMEITNVIAVLIAFGLSEPGNGEYFLAFYLFFLIVYWFFWRALGADEAWVRYKQQVKDERELEAKEKAQQ